MRHGRPKSTTHQHAAEGIHRLIIAIFGGLAFTCIIAGIIAIISHAVAKTEFSLLGAQLTTGHVGVALVGIGMLVSYFAIRAVLRNARDLASLPPDEDFKGSQSTSKKPNLRIELKSLQTKMWDACDPAPEWKPVDEGFALIVTNVGEEVSISSMDVFVKKDGSDEVLLPPSEPFVMLPRHLQKAHSLANNYRLGCVGALQALTKLSPRVVIKTSCGSAKTLGPTAFAKMRPSV